ncbi:hypothetical protein CK820_G0039303 [Pan troglodytes]|uniref:Uncharacterized protein n=1 Tax=Pan troglodytes TaxID=9598 RepID=A0A2J8KEJ9_PANTR|nr:hypothetical protein CK820_G0039303 [Pan troglodytes]
MRFVKRTLTRCRQEAQKKDSPHPENKNAEVGEGREVAMKPALEAQGCRAVPLFTADGKRTQASVPSAAARLLPHICAASS